MSYITIEKMTIEEMSVFQVKKCGVLLNRFKSESNAIGAALEQHFPGKNKWVRLDPEWFQNFLVQIKKYR